MKKLIAFSFIAACFAFQAQAQAQGAKTFDNYPYWTISKGVQQMQFKNVSYKPAQIQTGNNDWAISKGVQRISPSQQPAGTGLVKMTGRPSWTISKGVARIQAEKK